MNINELKLGSIIEIYFIVTNANKGQHLARLVKIEKRDYHGNYTLMAVFEVYTTVGVIEKDFYINPETQNIEGLNTLNYPVSTRTINRWNKKLTTLQQATRTLEDALWDIQEHDTK